MFIFESERQSASGGGVEREGDSESEAGSRLQTVSTEPNVGLESTNVRSRPEPKWDAHLTEPPRRPSVRSST